MPVPGHGPGIDRPQARPRRASLLLSGEVTVGAALREGQPVVAALGPAVPLAAQSGSDVVPDFPDRGATSPPAAGPRDRTGPADLGPRPAPIDVGHVLPPGHSPEHATSSSAAHGHRRGRDRPLRDAASRADEDQGTHSAAADDGPPPDTGAPGPAPRQDGMDVAEPTPEILTQWEL